MTVTTDREQRRLRGRAGRGAAVAALLAAILLWAPGALASRPEAAAAHAAPPETKRSTPPAGWICTLDRCAPRPAAPYRGAAAFALAAGAAGLLARRTAARAR